MGLGTAFLDSKKYNTVSLLKKVKGKSIVELVEDKYGRKCIKRTVYRLNLPFKKLKELGLPGIPTIYDAEEHCDEINNISETLVYEEFIYGQTLDKYQKDVGTVDEATIVRFFIEACDILIALHKNYILHRDIKPDNIMIDANGKLWLIDFDAARFYEKHYSIRKVKDTVVMGTPGFAPPEQYGWDVTRPESDIYSLAKTISTLLPEDYDGYLKPILKQCEKPDMTERYSSVEELKSCLMNPSDERGILIRDALSGNIEAQCKLGEECLSCERYEDALKWYERAAEQDCAEAFFKIGVISEKNIDEGYNQKNTINFYEKAATLGYVEAMYLLGKRYTSNDKNNDIFNKGIDYLKRACKLNHLPSKNLIVHLFLSRKTRDISLQEVYTYSKDLYNAGNIASYYYMATLCEQYFPYESEIYEPLPEFDIIPFNPEAINNGWEREEIKWYWLGNDNNNAYCTYKLALKFKCSQTLEYNMKYCIELLKKSIKDNFADADIHLAEIYELGPDEYRDYSKAFSIFAGAAHRGNLYAATRVAKCYELGHGTSKDNKKAVEWAQKAIASPYGVILLANYYYYGVGVQKDLKEAIRLCNKMLSMAPDNKDFIELRKTINIESKKDVIPMFPPVTSGITLSRRERVWMLIKEKENDLKANKNIHVGFEINRESLSAFAHANFNDWNIEDNIIEHALLYVDDSYLSFWSNKGLVVTPDAVMSSRGVYVCFNNQKNGPVRFTRLSKDIICEYEENNILKSEGLYSFDKIGINDTTVDMIVKLLSEIADIAYYEQ